MTFSIIARCPRTGRFGAAVASSSPAVAARCVRVRAGVGAAVSQNITDPALGIAALDLMAQGLDPDQALARLGERPFIDYRQLMAIDAAHPPAVFTGASALGTLASAIGEHAACAGNMLASTDVPAAMLAAFAGAEGPLADRLVQAMLAGQAAGGEEGPVHSAGLLVIGDLPWPASPGRDGRRALPQRARSLRAWPPGDACGASTCPCTGGVLPDRGRERTEGAAPGVHRGGMTTVNRHQLTMVRVRLLASAPCGIPGRPRRSDLTCSA